MRCIYLMNKGERDKILVLGGSVGQCHIISLARNMNCKVVMADMDDNCPGKDLADRFYAVSTDAVEDLIAIARSEKVSRVVSAQSDLGIVSASKINNTLGLPGIGLQEARLFSNKLLMRNFQMEKGFHYPRFQLCETIEDVREFQHKYGFPFIAKPLDSQGSRGVSIIRSECDMDMLMQIQGYNRDAKGIIVEEMLIGDEYTVEGVMVQGKHHTLCVSHKRHYADLPCVSNQLLYGWEEEYNDLVYIHDKLINATGLSVGVTHSEYIKTPKGFELVEFAARGGGSLIASHIVPAVSGWDPEAIYLNEIFGKQTELPIMRKKWAVLDFISLEERRIKKIDGIEKIKNMPGVIEFHLAYDEGDTVMPVSDDTNRHGYYIAVSDTKQSLANLMKQIKSNLKIVYYERGDNSACTS